MNKWTMRILTLLILLSMVLPFGAAAADYGVTLSSTNYTSASQVNYKTYNGIIANWGARDEVATFLSKYATEYYVGDYSYETMSQLSGGTSTSNAPSSALYDGLQDMMVSEHHTFTTYSINSSTDCRNLYKYTDCCLSDTRYVSTLYLGYTVSSTWDSGSSYNQEHVWPKSKLSGSNSTDIGDIMHLRAANPSENSARSNTAYGESSKYYTPNARVKGDCARTILYMYVRWGATSKMWGTSGVMESLDVLLKWMEEDPVDTWEMGRNDSVQSITGVRNVFVDYPEYAWLLFGREIPANMSTPSSSAGTVPNPKPEPEPEPEPNPTPSGGYVEFTVNSLGLPFESYTAGTATVDGTAVEWIQLGNYGNGIQMRDKEDKGTSMLWNTSALGSGITKIEFTYNSGKKVYDDNRMIVTFGNAAKGADCQKTLITEADTVSYVITPDASSYPFFYIEWDTSYSSYWDSIKVYYEDLKHTCTDYTSKVTYPTLNSNGYTTFTCTVCGDSYVENYTFPDVPNTLWSYNAIEFAVAKGFFSGYQSGNFGPTDNITRQDFVVVLARIAKVDLSQYSGRTGFPDVKAGDYYEKAVKWASSNGIVNGYQNGNFGVGDKITREQMVTILYNYAKKMGYDTSVPADAAAKLNAYADAHKITGYARPAVIWALYKGVISGMNATTIGPQEYASRGQTATILMNISTKGIMPI